MNAHDDDAADKLVTALCAAVFGIVVLFADPAPGHIAALCFGLATGLIVRVVWNAISNPRTSEAPASVAHLSHINDEEL